MEKLSPNESVEGANTVLRGSVRAPEGFSEGKPKAAKPRGRSPEGHLFTSAPWIFNSCSDYQFHEVYWEMKLVFRLYYSTV